jgi:threonine dehydrogenase-like Zn-dependent dehydrogenase
MRGLVFDKSLQLHHDLPMPVRVSGEALIKVLVAGICQTDIEITRGYMEFRGIPGHEFVGIVADADNAALIGKRVTGEINCGCGSCVYCLGGMENHCPNRTVLGIAARHGAFADYLTLPEKNLHIIPDMVSNEEAVFIEPLAACYRILEQVHIPPHFASAVLGDGRMGLLCAQVLKTTNCQVTLIGKHPEKMSLLTGLGIHTTLFDDCHRRHYDLVADCTGSSTGIGAALQLVKPQGIIVVKTTTAGERLCDLNAVVIDEVTILGSRCGPFAKAMSALQKKEVTVTRLITTIYPFSQVIEAFQTESDKGVVKVLVRL